MASLPPLHIPAGAVANVKIIETTSRMKNLPLSDVLRPPMAGFERMPDLPSWSFLVESSAGQKVLYDLGTAKNWEDLPPTIVGWLKDQGWVIEVEKDMDEILEENGVCVKDISAIIWSHRHFDHLGDPTKFPSSTELIVGPGFKEAFCPGYPVREDSPVLEEHFKGRETREITFEESDGRTLMIGKLRGYDFFGDGSFYLIDTPGHCEAHIGAMARTTSNPDTFIFMGGDLCHYSGEIRPSPYLRLPAEIKVEDVQAKKTYMCPGSILEKVQTEDRGRKADEPFFDPVSGDFDECIRTIKSTQEIEAHENVFFISAHDDSILGVVDLFPKSANGWKEAKWRDAVIWAFLKDFELVREQGNNS
ncbi:hypothetical protein FQN57_000692 [Myotisia sp. PD_48]|nr:hypothetical protein FQN57_000692 [Myotisia sp. PD_48]